MIATYTAVAYTVYWVEMWTGRVRMLIGDPSAPSSIAQWVILQLYPIVVFIYTQLFSPGEPFAAP